MTTRGHHVSPARSGADFPKAVQKPRTKKQKREDAEALAGSEPLPLPTSGFGIMDKTENGEDCFRLTEDLNEVLAFETEDEAYQELEKIIDANQAKNLEAIDVCDFQKMFNESEEHTEDKNDESKPEENQLPVTESVTVRFKNGHCCFVNSDIKPSAEEHIFTEEGAAQAALEKFESTVPNIESIQIVKK